MHWTGIHNENEFYSEHYLAEIFAGDVRGVLEDWTRREQAARERARAQGRTEPDWRAPHNRLAAPPLCQDRSRLPDVGL